MTASLLLCSTLTSTLLGCSSGGGGDDEGALGKSGRTSQNFGCTGLCSRQSLTAEEVRGIVSRGIVAAESLGVAGTLAIVDRVGNVLAVYQMEGANPETKIDGQIGAQGGLEGLVVPATLAAISKAGTGAYLSSQGNAFSSRTASQIVQEHFAPGQKDQPAGPLFGVQFSQLICSDITVLNRDLAGGFSLGTKPVAGGSIGPRPLPLGLSADPGGIPLYKNGDVVGGIGVELDGAYRLDRDISDYDDDIEERIAMHASFDYAAPAERVAETIFVAGRALRFTDIAYDELEPLPEIAPLLEDSRFVAVPPFAAAGVRPGATFGGAESGVAEGVRAGVLTGYLVGEDGGERFPPRAGTGLPGGVELTAAEVSALLDSAIHAAERSRAAIRRPADSPVQVSIFVVDTEGIPLGFVRSRDAPVFGIDVSLQKARGAAFFSAPDAGEKLDSAREQNRVGHFGDYVTPTRALLGEGALRGGVAFADRSAGNLSRPFFLDGIDGNPPGPFSLPFPPATLDGESWSPFNTGLQLDVVFQGLAEGLFFQKLTGSCADEAVFRRRLANGFQIFPGSVPLYRGPTLIGAIGVSGDGVDQDDLIAFFGASRRGLDEVGHTTVGDAVLGFNAPPEIRADTVPLAIEGARLRYVNCPEAPFIGSDEQDVCEE